MSTTHYSRTAAFSFERKVFFGVGAILIALTFLYIYFVIFSIAHVVEREALSRHAASVSQEVVGLEKRYLTDSQQMTELSARSFGLMPAESRFFVERRTITLRSGN